MMTGLRMFRWRSVTSPNVSALGPGSYTVQALSYGFKRATRRGVRVETGRNVRIDLILEIGEMREIIHPIGRYRDPAPSAPAGRIPGATISADVPGPPERQLREDPR